MHPVQNQTIVRMSTIPHGDSLLAQSVFLTTVKGGPKITPVSSLPTGPGVDEPGYLDPLLYPEDTPDGIDYDMVANPNLVLKKAIKGQNIIESVVISVSTSPVGGLVNIPFVVKNANAISLDAIFWIETVENDDGSTFLQLQYTQTVILKFLGIEWPHITVATLVQQYD